MIKNAEITQKARVALKNNWVNPMLLTVLYFLTMGLPSWIFGMITPIIGLFLTPFLMLGMVKFFLESTTRKDVEIELLFSQGKQYLSALLAYLLIVIGCVIGCVLLIVPGIIFSLATSMTFYILVENPDLKTMEAIKLSIQMMKGKKWKLFLLSCRFIGWTLLGILTLGIGLLWVYPYMFMSFTIFYQQAKADSAEPSAFAAEEPVAEPQI